MVTETSGWPSRLMVMDGDGDVSRVFVGNFLGPEEVKDEGGGMGGEGGGWIYIYIPEN